MIDKLYRSSELAQKYASGNTWDVERKHGYVVEQLRKLKPGARRLLFTVHRLLESKQLRPVNRIQIAGALQHTKLHHHDLKLLEALIAASWLEVKRVGLPRFGEQPRGFEYRYSMPIDTAWLINAIRGKDKLVFKSITKPQSPAPLKPLAPVDRTFWLDPSVSTGTRKSLSNKEFADLIEAPWYDRLVYRATDWFEETRLFRFLSRRGIL